MGSEWTYCQLGDVATIQGGFAFKSRDFLESGVPVAKIRNVRNRDIDLSEADCVSEDIAKEHSDFYVREGDVLISMTGSGINAPASIVGRVARHTGSNGDFLINQRVGRFVVCDNEKADLRYLYYFFSSSQIRNLLVSIATGSANQVNISAKQIESVELPLPPLREQEAIAHILGTLDDKIELNRRMNRTLEAIARAVFKSWFVDFDPVRAKAEGREPVGMDPETAALFPDSFQDSPLGKIPKGWEVHELGAFAEVVKGRSYRSADLNDSETALVTLKSIHRGGGYRHDGLKPYTGTYKPEQVVEPGEVVVSFTDVTQAADVIGKPAIVEASSDFSVLVASLDLGIVRPLERRLPRSFLLQLLSTSSFQERAYAHTTGTTVLHLSKAALPGFEFVWPGETLLSAFDKFVSPLLDLRMKNTAGALRSAAVRDVLLPRLLSGEISVA